MARACARTPFNGHTDAHTADPLQYWCLCPKVYEPNAFLLFRSCVRARALFTCYQIHCRRGVGSGCANIFRKSEKEEKKNRYIVNDHRSSSSAVGTMRLPHAELRRRVLAFASQKNVEKKLCFSFLSSLFARRQFPSDGVYRMRRPSNRFRSEQTRKKDIDFECINLQTHLTMVTTTTAWLSLECKNSCHFTMFGSVRCDRVPLYIHMGAHSGHSNE